MVSEMLSGFVVMQRFGHGGEQVVVADMSVVAEETSKVEFVSALTSSQGHSSEGHRGGDSVD